jgi:eukaryotic-like serine/threonine-protein kinase
MAKSETQLRAAYESRTRLFGADSVESWTTACRLAHILGHLNRVPEALQLLRPAEAGLRRTLGANHPETVEATETLALAYLILNRPEEGMPRLEEAREAWLRRHEPDHVRAMRSSYFLGSAHLQAGRWDEAAAVLEPLVASRRRATGPRANVTLFAVELLATAYDKLSRLDAAEPLWRDALALRQAAPPRHWQAAAARSLLGKALAGQKKYAEAEPLLLEGYDGLKKQTSSLPPRARTLIAEAADAVIELYTALGKKDEATRWRKERDGLKQKDPPKK